MKVGFFNRLIFILAAIIILTAALLMLVYTQDLGFISYRDIESTTVQTIDNLYHEDINYIPATVGAAVAFIISIWMFVLAFKKNKGPKAKPIEYITVGTEGNGELKIASSTLNSMISKNVNEITGVIDSKAKAHLVDDKTFVTVGVSLGDGVIIPKVCEEIQTTTKEKLQQLTGMDIEEINVLVNNK